MQCIVGLLYAVYTAAIFGVVKLKITVWHSLPRKDNYYNICTTVSRNIKGAATQVYYEDCKPGTDVTYAGCNIQLGWLTQVGIYNCTIGSHVLRGAHQPEAISNFVVACGARGCDGECSSSRLCPARRALAYIHGTKCLKPGFCRVYLEIHLFIPPRATPSGV